MSQVVGPAPAVNQNVVEKNKDEPTEVGTQHVVHERLESGRGVAQPEWHHQELVQAVMGAERHFVDVLRLHSHLIVPRPQVELREEARPVKPIQELVDDGDGEQIFDGEGVQSAVVDAEAPGAIRLLDKEDRRRERRVAAADDALLDHGGALALQLVLVRRQVPVWADGHRRSVWLEDDAVVAAAGRWQSRGLGEDILERGQQLSEEQRAGHGGVELRCDGARHAGPVHRAPLKLERHGGRGEVLDHRPEGGQPLRAPRRNLQVA